MDSLAPLEIQDITLRQQWHTFPLDMQTRLLKIARQSQASENAADRRIQSGPAIYPGPFPGPGGGPVAWNTGNMQPQ